MRLHWPLPALRLHAALMGEAGFQTSMGCPIGLPAGLFRALVTLMDSSKLHGLDQVTERSDLSLPISTGGGSNPRPPWAAQLLRGSHEMGRARRKHSQLCTFGSMEKTLVPSLGTNCMDKSNGQLPPCPHPQPQATSESPPSAVPG